MKILGYLALSAIFFLILASQITVTPLGEQMDIFGHISYICFIQQTGTIPRPHAPTVPAGVDFMRRTLPSPDQGSGERYKKWAKLKIAEQDEIKRAVLDPGNLQTEFLQPNYQTQHPPLYYWLLSAVYGWISDMPLDRQNLVLSLCSLLLAALAIPAVYLVLSQVFGARGGVLMTLLVAWLPNYMPFLGRITNDSLSFALFCWTIYLLVRNDSSFRHRITASILIAIALFTKSYALILLPLAVLGIWRLIGRRNRAKSTVIAGILLTFFLALAVAGLFYFNLNLSGHWLPLTEAQESTHASLPQKITGMFFLDPVWFYLNGLIRLFWWSGFWSMVSPGIYYYAPLAVFAGIAGYGILIKSAWRDRIFWRDAFPHLVVIIVFIAGMAWHASLFRIANAALGGAGRSGNEGWYLLVIAPSIFLVLLLPIKWMRSDKHWCCLLRFLASGIIVWNLLGRLSSYMYWSGGVRIHHFVRGMDVNDTVHALFDVKSWGAWLSLPGIIHPVWLSSVLPLILALIGSVLLIWTNLFDKFFPAPTAGIQP